MSNDPAPTFIVDCHNCRAKVAAIESGRAVRSGVDDDSGEPWGERVLLGKCPQCDSILTAHSTQIDFAGLDADYDRWTDAVRVFPRPSKAFSSYRIPRVVTETLVEADRCLQANANIAACVMFGRALEAVCQNIIEEAERPKADAPVVPPPTPIDGDKSTERRKPRINLGAGIKRLRDLKVIDDRLYDWSQQLQAFRNLAAHAADVTISRADAEDLQTFVYAIIEYIYDLADRYQEFKERAANNAKRQRQGSLI